LLSLVAKELSMTETSSGMAEEIVWRGTSSQWKNFGVYLLCSLFCWRIVPIFFAVARYFQAKCKIFELTTQRFKITSGIFSKVTDTLELYRVKDIETQQPFLSRLVGVENVQMNTSHASSSIVLVEAVPSRALDSRTNYAIRSRSFASKSGCVRSISSSDALSGVFVRRERG
jgi:uncharacterized membrane protein YdbT with pleckstrin-like domain